MALCFNFNRKTVLTDMLRNTSTVIYYTLFLLKGEAIKLIYFLKYYDLKFAIIITLSKVYYICSLSEQQTGAVPFTKILYILCLLLQFKNFIEQ